MSDLERLLEKARTVPARFDLQGKRALVVGGNKGLGQAMALALASAGADLCVAGRGPDGLAETAEAAGKLGVKGRYFAADVTEEAKVEELLRFMQEDFGGLDILVNSQGIAHLQASVEFDIEAWQRVLDVNLKSLVLDVQARGAADARAEEGKDHQYFVGACFSGTDAGPCVRAEQGSGEPADAVAGDRVGAFGDQRERDRAGVHDHGDQRGDDAGPGETGLGVGADTDEAAGGA